VPYTWPSPFIFHGTVEHSSRAFAMHAAFALIASILIALDIVAAARSMADLDITAPDIVSIEP
jgi:hypothetical protein